MANIRHWIWLSSFVGFRPIAMKRVLDRFADPTRAYYASRDEIESLDGVSPREKELLGGKDLERAEAVLEKCRSAGIRILTLQDAAYPERLREITDPPLVLYVRGELPDVDELPAIGIVGTRRGSDYGLKTAGRIGREIASAGGCVVTGMALGIDGAAARGALAAGGICIGVMGTAIDVDYPKTNAKLIRDTAVRGAIVSEFPPGYPTYAENFPRRNRIISGLSCGVCIVEAPERSGALITADFALEQGRDLFAVPGNVDNPNSAGTNALIQNCAKAVSCGADILSEYEHLYSFRTAAETDSPEEEPAPEPPPPARKKAPPPKAGKPAAEPAIDPERFRKEFSEDQSRILDTLVPGIRQIDEIIEATGLSPSAALGEMTMLLIRGAVQAHPGKRFGLNTKYWKEEQANG